MLYRLAFQMTGDGTFESQGWLGILGLSLLFISMIRYSAQRSELPKWHPFRLFVC
jgi:hypothetical protein